MSSANLPIPSFPSPDENPSVLMIGVGGGFDIFCGFPLYRKLCDAGYKVHLANHSFTDGLGDLDEAHTPRIGSFVYEVTSKTLPNKNNADYFPELYLAQHIKAPVYTFRCLPPQHLSQGLADLIKHLNITHIIGIDGGCDALLMGDEGPQVLSASPIEDLAMLLAIAQVLEAKLLRDAFLMCVSVPTEGWPRNIFFDNLFKLSYGRVFVGCASIENRKQHTMDYFGLLDRIPKERRSIPNECMRAALDGSFDVRPRLQDRFSENLHFAAEVALPVVTETTLVQWFFSIPKLVQQSRVLSVLFKTLFRDGQIMDHRNLVQVNDVQHHLVLATLAFNRMVRDFYEPPTKELHDC